MSEKWAWDGPPDNIHIFQADAPHMRVCFLTSDGPTEARANLIAAAPELLETLEIAEQIIGHRDNEVCKRIAAIIAKAKGRRS